MNRRNRFCPGKIIPAATRKSLYHPPAETCSFHAKGFTQKASAFPPGKSGSPHICRYSDQRLFFSADSLSSPIFYVFFL
jgi:hypothetical protein